MSGATAAPRGGELEAHLLMTAAMLFLAASVVVGRVYHAEVPPAGMAFWRAVAAFAVLAPFVHRELAARLPLVRRHWKLLLALGAAQTAFGQVPFFLGLHSTTAINGGLITATQPVLIFVLAWIVLRDPMRPLQVLGLALASAGVLAVIVRGDPGALWRLDFVVGDLLVQLGVLSWAVYFILVKRAPDTLSPLVLFQAMTLGAILAMVPCYAAEMLIWDIHTRFDAPTLVTVLYLAVFGSVLALIFFTIGIRRLGPSRSGAYNYLIPVFTALMAVAVLDESLRPFHLVGLALVSAGVYLVSRPARPRGRGPSGPLP